MPDMGEYASEVRPLHVATAVVGRGFLLGGEQLGAVGKLTAWVCRSCGYTELYTLDPEQIPVDGRFVHAIG